MADNSAVLLWLSGLPDGQQGSKHHRELDSREPDMAPPPVTRSQSPSKKRKINQEGAQDGDQDDDPSQDPSETSRPGPSSQRPALSIRPPSFFPPSTIDTSDRQSSRRSDSPVKTVTGLLRLDKPVLYLSLDTGKAGFQQLPEDVRQLYRDVLAVTKYQTGIYPAEIRPQIECLFGDVPPPDSVYRKPEEGARLAQGAGKDVYKEMEEEKEDLFFDYLPLSSLFADRPEAASPQVRFALAEFYKIRALERIARECLGLRRSEAAWNALVHGPLLELALSRQRRFVVYENVTAARILPFFRPSLVTGEVSEGKMVDFVIAPRLSPELDVAIQNRLTELYMRANSTALASAQLNVNQTDYTPLTRSPSAVSIETKVAGANLEEGRLQLGIWTAAWHKRMQLLGVGGIQGPPLPTLPLILVHDHQWSLYFAVDRLEKIEICGALPIGRTDTLSDIYQLLAVLGLLGGWVGTTFRSWATDTFGPSPPGLATE